jgi:hypothetical protein
LFATDGRTEIEGFLKKYCRLSEALGWGVRRWGHLRNANGSLQIAHSSSEGGLLNDEYG